MADYYTHFSFEVSLSYPELAVFIYQWTVKQIDACDGAVSEDCPIRFFDEDVYGLPELHVEESGVWITDSGGEASVGATAAVVRWLLSTMPGAPEAVEFEWSDTCSKPRLDAFGGGAARITADSIQLVHTSELSERMRDQPEVGAR